MMEKTILVVDTDTETIEKIEAVLGPEGFSIFSASGIDESIASAKKIIPSLIFVNIAMKDTSGLEISKAIHETEDLQSVPIVIMTPHGGTIEPRYTTTYGIVDFFKKPFSPAELISKTIDVLEMDRAAESLPAEVPLFSSTEADSAPHSFEEELSGEEQKITDTSVQETPFAAAPEEFPGPDESEQTWHETEPVSSGGQEAPDENFPEEQQAEPAGENDEAEEEENENNAEEEAPVILPHHNIAEKQDRAGWRKDLLMPIIGVLLVAIGVAFFLYKGLVRDTKTVETVAPKIPQTVIEQPRQNVPVSPEESTQQPADAVKKAPLPSGKKTARSGSVNTKKAAVQPKAAGQAGKKKSPQPQKPAAESKGFYAVQIGIFKSKQNATSLAEKYRTLHYHAFTLRHSGKNRQIMYRTLVGKFGSMKEAAALAKKIRSKEKIPAVIFHKK